MKKRRRAQLFDRLSTALLAATGLVCVCYLVLLFWSPLAAPSPAAQAVEVPATATPSPFSLPPTPMDTSTPTPRVTHTPVIAGTPTPRGPTPTLQPTITRPPTRTPPPTYGPSVTPSTTRSKFPFTAEITPQLSPFQCNWAGLMGGVYDLEGEPLAGYTIHVEGYEIDELVTSGDSQFVRVPGYDESTWDVVIDATGPTAGIWHARLYQPGTNAPVSDVYEVRLEPMCGASSFFIKFIQNH